MEQNSLTYEKRNLEAKIRTAAVYFYVIAVMSLVNTALLFLLDGKKAYVFGLGATQYIDAAMDSSLILLSILFDVLIALTFITFGLMTSSRMKWPLLIGIILYTLDAALLVYYKAYFNFGVHIFVLIFMIRGFLSMNRYALVNYKISVSKSLNSQSSSSFEQLDKEIAAATIDVFNEDTYL